MKVGGPRATVLFLHCVLFPVPFDPVTGPQLRDADPWEKMGNLSQPLTQKLQAYFTAHRLHVPHESELLDVDPYEADAVRTLPDGGELKFRYFGGGLVALGVYVTKDAADELVTLMRLCDFVLSEGEALEATRPTRLLALSQRAADAVPPDVGQAEVVAPTELAGKLYEWALGQHGPDQPIMPWGYR